MQNNKLEKLRIDSYQDKERKSKLGSFEVMFNPSSISLNQKNQYSNDQGINTSGAEANYICTIPRYLDLELTIDMTSVYQSRGTNNAKTKAEEFYKLCVMNGDIHQPPYLKIHWGEMQWGGSGNSPAFDCRISEINATYTLFARNGSPLRATLNTKFTEDIADKKRINLESKNSPDLTHTIVVTTSSNLPLLSQQVYQNPLHYLTVAQHNNLDSVRYLKPGGSLNFPPIVN